MKNVQPGKEYYFSTGRHAAIVRQGANGLEYLELQSWNENGWNALNDYELKNRFACRRSHTIHGYKYETASTLVDVEKFGQSGDFVEMLKYINTAVDEQKKGKLGGIK